MAIAAIIVGSDENLISATRDALVPLGLEAVHTASEIADWQLSTEAQAENQWMWFLAAGMVPEPDSLAKLLAVAESAPSAAWIAPKLVRSNRPRELEEFGLTVNAFWRPISPANGEFDQSQHDHRQDLLAASLLGSLIRVEALSRVWQGKPSKRPLTTDYKLAIGMRLAGFRVLTAAEARVRVAPETTNFSVASALTLRKTQIELISNYLNPIATVLLGLAAPAIGFLMIFWLLLVKRPEKAIPNLFAGVWWFLAWPYLLLTRPRIGPEQKAGLRALRGLRASREELQRAETGVQEPVAAPSEVDESMTGSAVGFIGAGGPWLMLLLAGLSFQYWPKGKALSGGSLLPLGESLTHLFNATGSSWQSVGFGFAGPSNPFNWVLLGLGSLTSWSPNLSVVIFFFLVKPLAFASAWRLLSTISRRPWVVTLGALTYALSPPLNSLQSQGAIGGAVALVLLPLFLFTLAQILQLGSESRRKVQTWTWVGASGLLAAAVSAGAPSLTPVVAVVLVMLAGYRFRRIGYLIWVPVPLLIIWAPYVLNLTLIARDPLAVLTDPGLPLSSRLFSVTELAVGGQAIDGSWFKVFALAAAVLPLVIAFLGTVSQKAWSALWIWLALLATLASAALFNRLAFADYSNSGDSGESAIVQGNPAPLLGLAVLLVAILLVMVLDQYRRWVMWPGSVLLVLSLAVFGWQNLQQRPSLIWSDGRTMPALVEAQARVDSGTRVLAIRPVDSGTSTSYFAATLVTGGGAYLEDLNQSYYSQQTELQRSDLRYSKLSELTANLIAGATVGLDGNLARFGIDYVLLQAPDRAGNTASALDTLSQLEPVGTTEFGRLWRVRAARVQERRPELEWSLTKEVQAAVLVAFGLLAIPTRRRSRSSNANNVDLDLFEGNFEGDDN